MLRQKDGIWRHNAEIHKRPHPNTPMLLFEHDRRGIYGQKNALHKHSMNMIKSMKEIFAKPLSVMLFWITAEYKYMFVERTSWPRSVVGLAVFRLRYGTRTVWLARSHSDTEHLPSDAAFHFPTVHIICQLEVVNLRFSKNWIIAYLQSFHGSLK